MYIPWNLCTLNQKAFYKESYSGGCAYIRSCTFHGFQQLAVIFPFHRKESWGSESLSDLQKVSYMLKLSIKIFTELYLNLFIEVLCFDNFRNLEPAGLFPFIKNLLSPKSLLAFHFLWILNKYLLTPMCSAPGISFTSKGDKVVTLVCPVKRRNSNSGFQI